MFGSFIFLILHLLRMSINELLQEVTEFARDQDETLTQILWDAIVEEIIDNHQELGDFQNSKDAQEIKIKLKAGFVNFLEIKK